MFSSLRRGLWLPSALAIFAFQAHAGTNTVISTADSGLGSLRWAITNANTSPSPNLINFQIPGSGPFSIGLATPLPVVTNSMSIDATTQPGYAGTPLVELNGSATGAGGGVGLQLNSGFNAVAGLAINRCPAQALILNGVSNVIQNNFIGTDTTGLIARGNGDVGIWVKSSGNTISSNLVSGGNVTGIYVQLPGNTIQGNRIGLDATGTNALGNNNYGILLNNSGGNLVGGTTAAARNIISGNHSGGIFVSGGGAIGNLIQGNYIGTDFSGALNMSNTADGITVSGAPSNTVSGNLISGNGGNGIFLSGASGNTLAGNFIGTDASGRLALGNRSSGVAISGSSGNLVGASNVISGNLHDGIFLTGGANGNLVQGNFIGLAAAGTNALPNGFNGVSISDASANTIGGAGSTGRNVISGNANNGVAILMVTDVLNKVVGNYIGTDLTGMKAVSNVLAGVVVEGCSNMIGGAKSGNGNVISGNGQQGIWVVGLNGNAAGNIVQGNFIGLNADGANALGNGGAGIGISSAAGNQIGGAGVSVRNLISANGDAGIFLIGAGATANIIQGNYIGTDATGALSRGNAFEGIYDQDVGGNQIGGSLAGAGNLISANHTRGVWLTNAPGNVVQGNYIGTTASGGGALGNTYYGLEIDANSTNNIVGGVAPGAGNLISANGYDGVYLTKASWNVIQGNLLGTKADGISNLGNTYHNIELDTGATNNTIGGTASGAGNRIAFAKTANYSGVRVRTGSLNNLISANCIFSNAELGIDLGPFGTNPNVGCESGVAPDSANLSQNFPVVTNVYSGSATQIRGTLDSGAGKTYTLQFFSSPSPNASGYGEGQVYLGQSSLTLSAACSSNFTAVLPVSIPAGWIVTATATDPANNTSEFSPWVTTVVVPNLLASPVNRNNQQMTLSWTNNGGTYFLQQTFGLSSPQVWTTITNPPAAPGGVFALPLPATNPAAFYRLATP